MQFGKVNKIQAEEGKKACLHNSPYESSMKTWRINLANQKMSWNTDLVNGEVMEWKDWQWAPNPIKHGINLKQKVLTEKWWQQTE